MLGEPMKEKEDKVKNFMTDIGNLTKVSDGCPVLDVKLFMVQSGFH